VKRNSSKCHHEVRVPEVSQNYMLLNSPGELRVRGVTRNSAFPESLGNPGSRYTRGLRVSHLEHQISGYTRNCELLESHGILHGVTRKCRFPELHRNPSSRNQPEIRVHGAAGNTVYRSKPDIFQESSGTPDYRGHQKCGFLESPGTSGSRNVITRNSGFPDSHRNQGSRSHPELQVRGVSHRTPVPGVNRKYGFLISTGMQGSRSHMEDSVYTVSPGTAGSRSHPELLFPGVTKSPS